MQGVYTCGYIRVHYLLPEQPLHEDDREGHMIVYRNTLTLPSSPKLVSSIHKLC